MPQAKNGRILVERSIGRDGETLRPGRARAVRSVTVNAVESPLRWLFARGMISRRQLDAGEQLRSDWERAGLSPGVTMKSDAAPIRRQRGGAATAPDLSGAQIDARPRFDAAIEAAGPACRTYCGGWFVQARACARRRRRSAGQPAPASSCSSSRSTASPITTGSPR